MHYRLPDNAEMARPLMSADYGGLRSRSMPNAKREAQP